ncbi:arginine ABC transporter permease [Gammaproteobacteria bacterium]|nr:arginine ABC transporter permease [Gammaproteobacteria bacterium]
MFEFVLNLPAQLAAYFGSGYVAGMLVGLKITLFVALSALFFGLILSLILASLELSKWRIVRWITIIFVTTIRSLPEILVVFIVALGLPYLYALIMGDFPDISIFSLGCAALALIYSSYASQTIRGALLSIPQAQWESGKVLGLNNFQIFLRIILPQMWRHALPGLGNQWLVLLKDTALVSLIGLHDMMFVAEGAFNATGKPFTWYSIAAFMYLGVSLISQYGQAKLAHYITHYERA